MVASRASERREVLPCLFSSEVVRSVRALRPLISSRKRRARFRAHATGGRGRARASRATESISLLSCSVRRSMIAEPRKIGRIGAARRKLCDSRKLRQARPEVVLSKWRREEARRQKPQSSRQRARSAIDQAVLASADAAAGPVLALAQCHAGRTWRSARRAFAFAEGSASSGTFRHSCLSGQPRSSKVARSVRPGDLDATPGEARDCRSDGGTKAECRYRFRCPV